MAKGKGSDDASGHSDSGAYRVFMDSNFDTHMLMIVSGHDTVRDLKEKIMIEHPLCFPNIGKIIVNALKVKCKGCFYHLSDSMLVKSVFNGFMKTWILQFDASRQGEHKENPYHLEVGASDLPIHVFTTDGPLPETNTHLLDYPSKDVSILAVPSVPQIGSTQPRDIFPKNSSDDKQKLKNADSGGLSTRLLEDDHLIPQNSSDDKHKPKSADSEGLNKDGPLLNSGSKARKKEKIKKKKPSIPYDQVDYAVLSGKNIREEETSRVALGNNHGDLEGEIGAALASEQKTNAADPFAGLDISEPGTSKVERRNTSDKIKASRVRKSKGSKKHQNASAEGFNLPVVAEPGNLRKDSTTLLNKNVCCDNNACDDARGETSEVALEINHGNLGVEIDAALTFGKNDAAGPFVDADIHKLGMRNVVRRDTSDHIEASRGRKLKGSKKHQAASAEGLNLPAVAEPGNLTKDSTPLLYKNVCCDSNVCDDARGDNSEVALEINRGNLGVEIDAALASGKTDAAGPFVDADMSKLGTRNVVRRDTSDQIEASRGRKSKGTKKHHAASVKGVDLPMIVELGTLSKESKTLVYENVCCDNSVGNDVREETEVAVQSKHGNSGGEFDAALSPEITDAADPVDGFDMSKPGTSKAKRRNSSDHVGASGGRKLKRLKKHKDASVGGLEMPVVVEPGNLTKENTTLVHENIRCDNNDGDDGTGKTEEQKTNLQSEDPKPTLSAAPNSKPKSMGLGKKKRNSIGGFISPNLLQSSDISGTGVDGDDGTGKSEEKKTDLRNEDSKPTLSEAPNSKLKSMGLDKKERNSKGGFISNLFQSSDISGTGDDGDDRNGKTEKKKRHLQNEDPKPALSAAPISKLESMGIDKKERNSKGGFISSNLLQSSDISGTGDDGTGKTEEKKTHVQNEDPKPTLSAAPNSKLKSMGLNERERNSKGGFISSNLLQSSDISGTGDSSDKKRKKPKKYKDSDQKVQTSSSGIEDTNGVGGAILLIPEVDKASFSDHRGDETNGQHDTLFQIEKAKVSKIKTVNAPVTGLDKDADNACGNQVDLVPQIQVTKIQEPVEGNDYKVKKKSKKTETSAKNLPDPTEKNQDAVTVGPALPFDKKKGKNVQTKNTKKTRLGKKDPREQVMDSMSEAEKDIGSRILYSKPCPVPRTNESSEVPSDIFAYNTERPLHEADNREGKHSSASISKGSDIMEVPKFESAKISYIDNFGPSQRQHEVAPGKELDVKDIPIERSDKELPSSEETKNHNMHSLGTSPYLQKSVNSDDNQGFKEMPQGDSFDVVKIQAPILKTKKVEAMVSSHNRMTSTTSGDKENGLPSRFSEKGVSTDDQALMIKIVKASGISSPVHSSVVRVPSRAVDNGFVKGNSADSDASGSSSERVHKDIHGRELKSWSKSNPVVAVKASSKKIGEVLNNSSHKKSLFATSGTIFSDSSSDSSEGAINNSETSTKSPSDSSSSSSSDYLEGANHTPRNALYGGKRKENGEDNLIYSQSRGPAEYIAFDMILKSSRSYKKAKLTASQSQLEESQPVDFVLDSLADR